MMKRCPTCQRTFEDNTLTFCLDDGTPLVIVGESPDESTVVTPSAKSREMAPTQYGELPGKATVSASNFEIPQTDYAAPPQRRMWPWVVGGLALFFLLIVVIAAVIAIPKIASRSRNDNREVRRETPAVTPSESSSPSQSPVESEAPSDEDLVLSQLTEVEKQWTNANVTGNRDDLEKVLAAEYESDTPPRTKQEYLDGLKADPTIKSYELEDLNLELDGERATLNGYLRQQTTRGTEVYDFGDEFVWRDGRWQAVSSRASRVK